MDIKYFIQYGDFLYSVKYGIELHTIWVNWYADVNINIPIECIEQLRRLNYVSAYYVYTYDKVYYLLSIMYVVLNVMKFCIVD